MKTGVRIAALKEKPAAMRRRPVQSRAYASSQALQEAFVRVLIEDGFEKTTVREVTAVGFPRPVLSRLQTLQRTARQIRSRSQRLPSRGQAPA